MNTKVLCITVLVFTTLIFWGNRSAARTECEFPDGGCETCRCEVTMSVKNPDLKKEPSCSVVFRGTRNRITSANELLANLDGSVEHKATFDSCGFLLYCDKEAGAKLRCQDERTTPLSSTMGPIKTVKSRPIWGDQRCFVTCEYRAPTTILGITVSDSEKVVRTNCAHWERPEPTLPAKPVKKPPTNPPGKKPPSKKPGTGLLSSRLNGASWLGFTAFPSFVPTIYNEPDVVDPEPVQESEEFITDSTRWTVYDNGEAGVEQGVLMVGKGVAGAHAFCTGDTVRITAPNMMSMPTCPGDVIGRWEGAFARPRPKGMPPGTPRVFVQMSLDLRKGVNGALSGEIKTADGTYNISGSQDGAKVRLEAVRTDAPAKISLQGDLTKGTIVFGGTEVTAQGVSTGRLVGYFRRMYIADSALPIARLNSPYSFALTAFSPGGDKLTFRLAKQASMEQITWKTTAESLRGSNGGRFTYDCPEKGTPQILWGTDVYSDDSSICAAAVHSGVISLQAGGSVTIQIQPGASSYTRSVRNGISSKSYGSSSGSFVFVGGAPSGGERGRLPQGLSFDTQSGTFSGTPTESGSFDLNVAADDGAGNVFEQRLLLIVGTLRLTNALLHDAIVGEPYAADLNAAGGQPPYQFSGSPPKGIQLDPLTGRLSGTPLAPAPFSSFDVTIRDSQNNTETQKVTLSVRGATMIGSHFLPDARAGVPYRTRFQAIGSSSRMNWAPYGTDIRLIGLVLNEETGEISGTPTRAGSFLIHIRAEVGGYSFLHRRFNLTIK